MDGRTPGENIDTSRHRGEHPEYSGDWSDWVLRRMSHLDVMRHAGLSSRRGSEWGNVVEHSLVVNATAVFIARRMDEAGVPIDVDVVDQASLLHDVSKAADKIKGANRDGERRRNRLRLILEEADYEPRVIAAAECTGRVIEMVVIDQKTAIEELSWEELVVGYADAIVRNTDIVGLEEARKLNGEKIPADKAFYDTTWYPYYKNVENWIMEAVGDPAFTSESINHGSVRAMVAGAAATHKSPPQA